VWCNWLPAPVASHVGPVRAPSAIRFRQDQTHETAQGPSSRSIGASARARWRQAATLIEVISGSTQDEGATDVRHAELRERVCEANHGLVQAGLVVLSFGNASGVDRDAGVVAIKPSGVDYSTLHPAQVVLVSLDDGRVVDGTGRPSSDTPTHRVLYRAFPTIGGIVHTHSVYATSWAQAGLDIPCLGTTHADHFHGSVPVTRKLTDEEIGGEYELNTGMVIVERFADDAIDPEHVPACLDVGHGPFIWGPTPEAALENAIALELVAKAAIYTHALAANTAAISRALHDRHFLRKHGSTAYYGQSLASHPTK
jgi:L-ribulose-5-phosphate 4-epimerase